MSSHEQAIKNKIKEEYRLCAQDPIYFIKKYVKIEHPGKGVIPFELFPFQEDVLNQFRGHNKNIVLKARQMGISTVTAAYCLWLMVFFDNKKIVCLATKQDTAKEIVTRCKFGYEHLPSWLRPLAIENNKLSLELKTGGRIAAETAAIDSARGKALSLLILDEVASMKDADEIWTAAQSATTHGGGRAILISCVTKDTYVFTNQGIKQVNDFIKHKNIGGYNIENYSILGKSKQRTGNLFKNNGICDTIKIKTKFSELEGSSEHKLWAYKKSELKFGWYKLKDLSLEDFVSIQYGMNIWGGNDLLDYKTTNRIYNKNNYHFDKITPALAYFFGLYISEGYISKSCNKEGKSTSARIHISCGDPEIKWCFEKLNIKYHVRNNLQYTINSKNLLELFEYVGFDISRRAQNKIIPKRLLEMSRENMIYLLRGIFDGDGTASKGNVSITSTSSILIDQLRIILNNFGILSSRYVQDITKKNLVNKKNINPSNLHIKGNYDSHILEIYGKNALQYFNEIGFCLTRKQNKKELLLAHNLNRSSTSDIIPNSVKLVKELVRVSNKTTTFIYKNNDIFLNCICNNITKYKTNNVSRELVLKLYDLFGKNLSIENKIEYDKILSSNLCWVKIDKILYDRKETYDFSLPENDDDFWCHSIIYNGFLGHQTPKGIGNFYHKMWVDAENGENGFNAIRLHWRLHPEYDQTWRDEQTKTLGEKAANQECEGIFLGTGHTVIDEQFLKHYRENVVKEPISKTQVGESLWTWKYANYSKQYLVSADVARGDGNDFSAAQIIDLDNLEQVAEFKGKMPPKEFGAFCIGLASQYNNAVLVIENNSFGHTTIQECIDREYPNLFYSTNDLQFVDVERNISNKLNRDDKRLIPGHTTTSKNRVPMISKLEMAMREKSIIINSQRTIDELTTFIWNNGKPEAMRSYNDDLIMSLCIALWIRDTAIRLKVEKISLQKELLLHMGKTKLNNERPRQDNYSTADKTTSGTQIYSIGVMNKKENPYIYKMGNGHTEDFKWLL